MAESAKRHARAMTSVINIHVTWPDVWLNLLQHLTRCTTTTRLVNTEKKVKSSRNRCAVYTSTVFVFWLTIIPKQRICSKFSLVTFTVPLKAGAWKGMVCTCVSTWLFAKGVFGAGSAKGISFLKADSVSTFSLFSCCFDATFLVTGVDSVNSVSSSWASCLECYERCNKKKKKRHPLLYSDHIQECYRQGSSKIEAA